MLIQAKLSLDFWAEACNAAVYVDNCSPTTALKDKTPFECLFGQKQNVSHLRVFGCLTYVLVPSCQRRKLDAKARKAIFVGYPPGIKGYKVYDIEKKCFIISRNVKFLETRFDHLVDDSKSGDFDGADLNSFFYDDERSEEIAVTEITTEGDKEPVGAQAVLNKKR
eukprot:gene2321-biopygen2063